ncbi:MAG: DUF4422 domain-containing protein [Oscillospiraceae bacterium]|nr:DUF4422 domain-containing protein [Oscillospiraceae bacterium]
MKIDIKLLVCCHREDMVPELPLLVPVQVGAALADRRFPRFRYDDDGENISHKNRSYCELTAIYWAWKNISADHYGLFHYRRYLYPSVNSRRPYIIESAPAPDVLERLNYAEFENTIKEYDMVVPIGENMHISVYDHYARAKHHRIRDLDIIKQIIAEKHPEMTDAMNTYLSGTISYFGNMFIMRRAVFHEYCEWLFSVLEEYDAIADVSDYDAQESRVDGYLAERLLGIYYTFRRSHLKTTELPRVLFVPDKTERNRKKLLNILLPPGSKRRSIIKRMANRTND